MGDDTLESRPSVRSRVWAPAVGLWAAPVVALALLLVTALRLDSDALTVPAPSTVEVQERVRDLRVSVTAELSLGPAPVARAARAGTVTAVGAVAGDPVAEGSVIVRVDGVAVFAARGSSPLYRGLTVGDRGPDVAELHGFLGRVGIAAPGGEVYTGATARAVRELQAFAGVRPDGRFTPDLVAFVPPGADTVREVLVQVGDTVSPGSEILRFDRLPTEVHLRPADERRSLAALADQPVVLSAASGRLDLASLDRIDLAAFSAFLAEAAGLTITDEGDVRRVSGLVVALADPQRVGAVPAAAIVSMGSAVCVVESTAGEPRVVRLDGASTMSTEIGVALVPADLIGHHVVLDPTSLPAAVLERCG